METPVLGYQLPTEWQEVEEWPSTIIEMAREMAISDGESPEDIEALFYGLLDLPDEEVVQRYYSRF